MAGIEFGDPDPLFRGVSKDGDPKARKAARQVDLEEILARQLALEAKAEAEKSPKGDIPAKLVPVTLPPEVIAAQAKLAQAGARRAELKLIAGMDPDEHRKHLDAKAAKKRERQRQLDEMRGR